MLTIIDMRRTRLITKEKMENYTKGKEDEKESINDDLESLFEDLRLGIQPRDLVQTYFLPKLTEEELKLSDEKDTIDKEIFLESFTSREPDVDKAEMIASKSRSKFILSLGWRETFTIENQTSEIEPIKTSSSCSLQ